jgi:hypothetical protein
MTLDLYTADINRISFNDIEEFLGMSSPIELRPTEGTSLYKADQVVYTITQCDNTYFNRKPATSQTDDA